MSRRGDNPHRHTVPNASYASFPCYQEELQLKTNLRQRESKDESPDNRHDEFQLNVSMHDKLKMCFAEMETMKDQFDTRRRRLPTKKKSPRPPTDASSSKQTSSELPNAGQTASSQQWKAGHSKLPFETSKASQPTVSDSDNKFTAHLIRTSSKDSVEASEKDICKSFELLSHSPAYEETFISATGHPFIDAGPSSQTLKLKSNWSRRATSDPFGEWSRSREGVEGGVSSTDKHTIYGERYPFESHKTVPTNWSDRLPETRHDDLAQTKNAETRRSYDEWLQKLDQVNDISRSTLKRIKHLESEMTHLKNATDSLSCRQKSPKAFASRIPVKSGTLPFSSGNVLLRNSATRHWDKSTNTDIDFKFMNELLSNWNSRPGVLMANLADLPFIDEPSRPTKRRLTATIGRSVEIQTEAEQKSREEKASSTEDWQLWPNLAVMPEKHLTQGLTASNGPVLSREKHSSSQMSILDMPNIETGQLRFPQFVPDESRLVNNAKTPEPIVEIYSDSEDTSFDDFEKNIYNQISRRALIKSRLVSGKHRDNTSIASADSGLDHCKLRNSSTQTSLEQEQTFSEKPSVTKVVPSRAESSKKNLRSTSKITIERVRMDQKEKSEIVLKTDIDKEGVVHRTTEVKNRKFKQKDSSNRSAASLRTTNEQAQSRHMRKVNSDMNVCHSRNQFSRPLSAIDISNSEFVKKKDTHFMSDKALSSIDIAAKSPVISEGYHSEYLDSSNRMHTPSQEYLIEPPKSFQNETNSRYCDWEEVSKSEVKNKMVNEEIDGYKDLGLGKGGFVTLTNETVIDNTGKQTNITTKSRTIRKYNSKDRTKSSLDLTNCKQQLDSDLSRVHSASQSSLAHHQALQSYNGTDDCYDLAASPRYDQSSQRVLRKEAHSQPSMCNFSLIYNCDNNVVFRANFGLAKLPCFETNL